MNKDILLSIALIFLCTISFSQEFIWGFSIGAEDNESINDIVTDTSGNIYATGYYNSTVNFNPTGVTNNVTASFPNEIYIAKYNSVGLLQWVLSLGNAENCYCSELALDNMGNIIATGFYQDSIDLDPGIGTTILNGGNYFSGFLAKYDAYGNLIFGKGLNGNIKINTVATDIDNNILIAGNFNDSLGVCDLNPFGGAIINGSGGFVAKYDNNGIFIWEKHFENATALDLCVDTSNVFIVGNFTNSIDFNPISPEPDHTAWAPEFNSAYLVKFGINGDYYWSNAFIGQGIMNLNSVVIDTDNNIICGGNASYFFSLDVYGPNQYYGLSLSSDIFIAKFTNIGTNLWVKTLGNQYSYENVNDISVNALNNIIISGNFNNSFDADNDSTSVQFVLNKGLQDIYNICLDSDGNYQRAFVLGSYYDEAKSKVFLGDDFILIVAGQYKLNLDLDITNNENIVESNGQYDVFFSKYDLNTIITSSTTNYFNEFIVKDINIFGSSNPQYLFKYDSCMLFIAEDAVSGVEVWITDGLESGTRIIKEINPNGNAISEDQWTPSLFRDPSFVRYGEYVLFKAIGSDGRLQVWRTDGSEEGTELFTNIDSVGPYSNLIVIDSILYFEGYSDTCGWELWRSNGTEAGTYMVKDINPTGDGVDWWMCNLNGTLIFKGITNATDRDLWRSDGTEAGTFPLTSIGGNPQRLTPADSLVYYTNAIDIYGEELWVSDGTVSGTSIVKDIVPGTGHSSPYTLFAVGNKVYFNAWESIHGREVWVSDGTDTGTYMIKDIYPGIDPPVMPDMLFGVGKHGDDFYFTWTDDVHGEELWKTDGTDPGTYMVKDIFPGVEGYGAWDFTEYDSTLFFVAYNGTGWALWQTDGIEANTRELIIGTYNAYNPYSTTFNSGFVYFRGTDAVLGDELWKYRLIDTLNINVEQSSTKSSTEFQLCSEFFPPYATDPSFEWEITKGSSLGNIDNSGFLSLYSALVTGDTIVVRSTATDGSKEFNEVVITSDIYTGSKDQIISNINWSLYPNPVTDILYYNTNEIVESISVFNIEGMCILSYKPNDNNSINLSGLSSGFYIVKFTSINGESRACKIIKE